MASAVDRSFTGASAAAGMHLDLWKGGAFVTNYSHNYRAPSLEELYNYGPHVGNLAYGSATRLCTQRPATALTSRCDIKRNVRAAS
ncbi:MAG: hypothetical protein R2724_20350 [Bryobacterales bacterium]